MAKSGEDAQSPGEQRADEIEEDEEPQGNQRDGADVSRVTDYVEEKELDQSRAAEAVATITAANDAVVSEAERERERQLAAVSIAQEDVALIAFEMELETAVAERKLREHGGDITKALGALLAA